MSKILAILFYLMAGTLVVFGDESSQVMGLVFASPILFAYFIRSQMLLVFWLFK